MRLFWKILVGYWLAWALLTAAILGTLSLAESARWLPGSEISQTRPSAGLVGFTVINLRSGGEPLFHRVAETWPRGEPPFVVDETGRELLGREVAPGTLEVARSLAEGGDEPAPAKWAEGPDGRVYVVFYPQGVGPADRTIFRWILEWPWLVGIILAVAGLLLAGGLTASWTRPIRALKAAFDELAAGGLDGRVDRAVAGRGDEIGELGRHFDAMAARLGQLVRAQRQLLHDVSHELRSPLARLGVAVELARRRPDRAGEALDRIEKESLRLDQLVSEVLTLARLEAGARESLDDYVDLVELLRVIREDAGFEASAAGVGIVLQIPESEELVVRGNAELLHRAVENVVRNAVKHAADSDRIELSLEPGTAGEGARIRVHDHGEGLAEGDLQSLFEPFKRGSGSGGFGLGLAIARRAVEVHGGSIRARIHPEGGVEMEIELPPSDGLRTGR